MPRPTLTRTPSPNPVGLVHRANFDRPHHTAEAVIARLAVIPPAQGGLKALRQQHARNRRQFLAPLEEVHSYFHILGSPGVPRLTVIRPTLYETQKSLPALVYLHGGGWTLGAYETYAPLCHALANATGSILIWVDYRLSPEHPFPAPLDDARAALRFVRDNSLRLGVDASRVMIGGDSAGGNLAAAVALMEREEASAYQPWRQVLLYPCMDLTAHMPSHTEFAEGYLLDAELYRWYRANYIGGFPFPADWRLSPLFAPDLSGLPPTVLLHAGFDPLRDEAAAYGLLLSLAGVPVKVLSFPDMIHGFLTMGGAIPAAGTAVTRIAQSLQDLS